MSKQIKVVKPVHPALYVSQMGGARDLMSVNRQIASSKNAKKNVAAVGQLDVQRDPTFWQTLQQVKPVSTVDQYLGDAIKMGLDYVAPGSSGVYDVGVNISKQLGLGKKKKKPGPKKGKKKNAKK